MNDQASECFKTYIFLLQEGSTEVRKIPVPANRYTPLKESWMKIFTPIVEHLKLQIRFNLKTRHVELRVSSVLAPVILAICR